MTVAAYAQVRALRRFVTRIPPAVQALLIQLIAFLPTLAALFLLARAGVAVGYPHAALLQGGFAATLTWWRRLAPWWRAIQFIFPLALLLAQSLALPPWLFLAGFVAMLLLFWSTFRTQVPYYPSSKWVRGELARLLPPGRPARVIDIGCGFGGLVLALARARPDALVEGIELAPLPWLACRLRAAATRSRARFLRGDYENLDFGQYNLVFAYLSPAAMSALWCKASREMGPGSVLASYEFVVAERAPDRVVPQSASHRQLYIWDF